MAYFRNFTFCPCLWLVSILLSSIPVWGQDNVLGIAKALDDVSTSGMTIFCTSEKHFPGIGLIPVSTTKYDIRFTRSKDKIAVIHDNTGTASFRENPPDSGNSELSSAAISGRKVICFDKQKSAMKDYILYWDDAEKAWLQKESNVNLLLADADSGTVNAWTDHFLWIIGRGIVGTIVDVTESKIETDKEDIKHFLLRGTDKNNHIWDIDLHPDRGCMIRKAVRLRDGKADVIITTSGYQLFDECFFPQNALVEVMLGNKIISTNYCITNAALAFNGQIYNEAKNDIDKEMPQGALIHDESAGQAKTYVNGSENDSYPVNAPYPVNRGMWIFFVLVNVILIVWIVYANFYKK